MTAAGLSFGPHEARAPEEGTLGTYVLDMVEAEWGAPPRVLEGLRGEGLVVAMDEAIKREEMLIGHRGLGVGTTVWQGLPGLGSPRPLSHTGHGALGLT